MFKQGQEIVSDGRRRSVVAVVGNCVWYRTDADTVAFEVPIDSVLPLPPAGRECEAEWRVPRLGETYYDSTGRWLEATCDWSVDETPTDPLNLGWRRPVLKPLPANKVKGLEVADRGVVNIRYMLGGSEPYEYVNSLSDSDLAGNSYRYSPADIALIRAGLPADVQAYLNAKPADAEAELRVPTMTDWYYPTGASSPLKMAIGNKLADMPLLGRRRWIRKAAKAEVHVQPGATSVIDPACGSGAYYTPAAIVAEVVTPKLPEMWLKVWTNSAYRNKDGYHTSYAYLSRARLEEVTEVGGLIVRIPASGGAT